MSLSCFRPERVLFRPGRLGRSQVGHCLRRWPGRISTARPPTREAVPLPAKAGERNEQILPPKGGKRNDQIMYASAQALPSAGELVLSLSRRRASSFLARAKNPSFPNGSLAGRGIRSVFPDGAQLNSFIWTKSCIT